MATPFARHSLVALLSVGAKKAKAIDCAARHIRPVENEGNLAPREAKKRSGGMSDTRVWRQPSHLRPLAVISLGVLASFAWATFLVWLLLGWLTM
jgi:hypothetical protein